MTPQQVRPNRRGVQSRERVLDAAERVMSEEGFEAATIARVVEVSGIPLSSVYHYYGSKERILLAVMERGALRFHADLGDADERVGSAVEHLQFVTTTVARTLERHPDFLRLLIGFAAQPPRGEGSEVHAVVDRVRAIALRALRKQIALALGRDRRSRRIDQLARFALAAIEGAFIAWQTDEGVSLDYLLEPLAGSIVSQA